MATTVEDILVRFNGDASNFVNASEKAKVKTFTLGEQLLKLDKQMQKVFSAAVPDMAKADELFRKMENSAKRLAMQLETIKKQEGKAGGGPGAFGMFTLAGAASAVTSRVISAIEPMMKEVALNIGSALEQSITGSGTSLSTARRIQEREDDRAGYLGGLRSRGFDDQGRAVDRDINSSAMKNPLTGQKVIEKEIKAREDQQKKIQDQMKQSQNTIKRFEKEMEDNDSVLSAAKEARYAEAKKGLEEETKYYRHLEQAAHDAGEKIKDLKAQGGSVKQYGESLQIDEHRLELQNRFAGMEENAVKNMQRRLDLADKLKQAGGAEAEEIAKAMKLIEKMKDLEEEIAFKQKEQADAKRREAVEDAKQMESVKRIEADRFKAAGRGFKGVEAEVLGRNSQGNQYGNAERLKAGYEEEAAAINDKFLPATVKAQLEIDRLNMLREKGLLNQDAYDKAILEQAKAIDSGGRAGSRAATVTGSAEYYSRKDEYQRTMDQPRADSAAVDRAMKESRDNPVVKAIREQSTILRQIEKGVGKEGQVIKPANVEN